MMPETIYLDHAAATPLDERVLQAMVPYFSEQFYNPSSPYEPALRVKRAYQEAKDTIARCLGVKADELVMTAGATESINLAFHRVSGHVVISAIEHQAVLRAAERHDHTVVSVDAYGQVDSEAIRRAIQDDTELISIGLANNEIGTIQPLADIGRVVEEVRRQRLEEGNHRPIFLHSDASQGVGQVDVTVARLGVDMLTLNAGKIYGPKQVGLLYVARHVHLTPQVVGGGQELGLRSGTENVAGVIGFAKAMELADASRKSEVRRLRWLRDQLEKQLTEVFPDAVLSGHHKHRLASCLHISFPNIDAERLVFLLEAEGVLVATGSACAANKGTRSHVLTALGLSPEVADGSLRLTLGHGTDTEAIERAAGAIISAVKREQDRTAR
jgi:cysteine desulfurase